MTKFRSLGIGIVIVAISVGFPITAWAKISPSSAGESADPLTFNYSLAIRGDHPNIPTTTASAFPISGLTRANQFSYKMIHAQSSSTATENLEGETSQRSSKIIIIDEEVPSYIVHTPAFRQRERTQQTNNDSAPPSINKPQVTNQESSDIPESISPTTDGDTTFRISQIDRPLSFPRFDWPKLEYVQQPPFSEPTPEIASQLPIKHLFTGLSKPHNPLARFVDVLHTDWEPLGPEFFPEYGSIPLVINDAVAKNLRYFKEGISDRFQAYLDRFHHYQAVVEPIFREFGIPTELMYLSLVESGFNQSYFRIQIPPNFI